VDVSRRAQTQADDFLSGAGATRVPAFGDGIPAVAKRSRKTPRFKGGHSNKKSVGEPTRTTDGTRGSRIASSASGLGHPTTWRPPKTRSLPDTVARLAAGLARGARNAGFPSHYRTIRAGDFTGSQAFDIVARTSTGITTWGLRPYRFGGHHWVKLSTGPTLTGPVWDESSHYDTIRLGDIIGHGPQALIIRGVFGVRTFTWQHGTFQRPTPYGHFPAFPDSETRAYAEVSRLLLGREGDFRKLTYGSPTEAITEATLGDYRARLAERCTPVGANSDPVAEGVEVQHVRARLPARCERHC
jgi:hypothetical protein